MHRLNISKTEGWIHFKVFDQFTIIRTSLPFKSTDTYTIYSLSQMRQYSEYQLDQHQNEQVNIPIYYTNIMDFNEYSTSKWTIQMIRQNNVYGINV